MKISETMLPLQKRKPVIISFKEKYRNPWQQFRSGISSARQSVNRAIMGGKDWWIA